MGVIVDLFPALPRRMYLARPQLLEAERFRGSKRRSAPAKANAPLGCLSGGTLASRFHAWHGRSGRRYVCSVYPVDRNASSGGLPDLDDAVVIAVAIDRRCELFCVAVFESLWGNGRLAHGDEHVEAALQAGAQEWHVHLLAASPDARRAAIRDLEIG